MESFPYMGEILRVFLTFMEVSPIPPLSRGRSGGGWGICVAVVLHSFDYIKWLIVRIDHGYLARYAGFKNLRREKR